MQHIAREGGCWVVSCGCAFQARDIPEAFPGKAELFRNPDEWVNSGDSVVVAPGGKVVAGPLHEERAILYAEIELERVGMARRSLDVVGHYARPDLFHLQVNSQPQKPLHSAPKSETDPISPGPLEKKTWSVPDFSRSQG
jgi:nitrilase